MAISHVESLVLRGVSVLGDGQAVGLRTGSYTANAPTPKATPFSKRHPSLGCEAMPERSERLNAVLWAGRLSRAGVLGCRSRTIDHRWSATVGGPLFTAAARLCPNWAKQPAPVGDVFSGRPSTLHDIASTRFQRDERGRQATRALTAASTRGRGF